ncbi:Hypothetical predicted protein [Octopus vulgaris]|uniref:Uncharacterized protein n=1 Tax=Octopus vulgaris TaxID=6645 RepID=A0AA36ASY9_OCTVU|nr:Hypothetical predicted protein [Octopus vulgaris]
MKIKNKEKRIEVLDFIFRYSSMVFYHSVKSFYSLHEAVNYAEENESPSDENFIDIVAISSPVDELTDEEDFDDETLDDENRDPTFISQDVPGNVELHRFDNEEELTQPKRKRIALTLLDFKSSVTQAYLELSSGSDPKKSGRPKVFSSKVLPETRFSTTGHIPD